MRTCTQCKSEKAESDFYADKRRPDGLASECKDCTKRRTASRAVRTPEDPEKARARSRRWYERNKERARQRHEVWKQENPHRRRDIEQSRRARAGGYFDEHVDRIVLLARHGGACGICGNAVDLHQFDVDHIVPISRGGRHSYENTQPAHPRCNQSKKNRLMTEMRQAKSSGLSPKT